MKTVAEVIGVTTTGSNEAAPLFLRARGPPVAT